MIVFFSTLSILWLVPVTWNVLMSCVSNRSVDEGSESDDSRHCLELAVEEGGKHHRSDGLVVDMKELLRRIEQEVVQVGVVEMPEALG